MTDITDETPTSRRFGWRTWRGPACFAMLAVDQREAMRAMFAEHQAPR